MRVAAFIALHPSAKAQNYLPPYEPPPPTADHPWCRVSNDTRKFCFYSSQEECLAVTAAMQINEVCNPNPYYRPPPSLAAQFGGWIRERLDDWEQSKKDAERRKLRKIAVECQASSATEAQAAACYALRTGKY
jgi:hypothetical protein